MSDALQRKLKRLGVVKGAQNLASVPEKQPSESSDSISPLPGQEHQTEYGVFWLDKRVYQPEFQHGNYILGKMNSVEPGDLSIYGVPDLGKTPAFIDTETTGLAGGAGTIAFLIGIGVWNEEAFVLHLVFIRNPDEEEPALRYVAEILSTCTGLVTFNGRSFDMPILQTRFILNRMVPNWLDYPHLDLLPVARRLWRDHLPSRRLGVIEEKILGIARTDEDLPSYLIPYFYRQYLKTGQTTEMRQVMYHNEIDILSLVTLLVHSKNMVAEPDTMNLAAAEWAGVGEVFFSAGAQHQAINAWDVALAQVPEALPPACTSRLCGKIGLYHKRRTEWQKAMHIWDLRLDAVPEAVKPLVEKAKYFEWTESDPESALMMTNNAITRIEEYYEGYKGEKLMEELLHRQERLLHKIKKNETTEGQIG